MCAPEAVSEAAPGELLGGADQEEGDIVTAPRRQLASPFLWLLSGETMRHPCNFNFLLKVNQYVAF